LKKYILFLAITMAAVTVRAQSGYNYQEWGAGLDVSYIRGYTNVQQQYSHPAASLNVIYNYNPYVPIVLEVQKGTLSGGGLTANIDKYGRQYTNNYLAFYTHVDIQLGSTIDYEGSWFLNVIKNFYLGSGVGFVINNNTVQRTNIIPANGPLDYVFPGNDHSVNFAVPLRTGYEFKIWDEYNEPSMAITLGYTHNIVFGEGLDGYNDPPSKFKNNAINQYRQIVIGFKYYFGNVVSYNKLIRAFNY
jgi:hypothetical protein